MKILICSLTYPLPNGVTVSINTSVDGFLKRGVKVRIISPDYDLGKARPEHFPVPSSSLAKSIGVLIGKEERTFGVNAYGKIDKIVKEFNPDAYWLHTLSWAPNAFERHMIKSNKAKVLTYHTMVEEYGRIYAGKVGAVTMRLRSKDVCNKMDSIITPSHPMEKKLREYGVTKPIHVIPTGIEMPKTSFKREEIIKRFNIPKEDKILLFVGRISKEKNIIPLLRLTKELKDKKFDATLLLVGPGDINEIKNESAKLKIKDKAVFTGPLPKIEAQKIYGACDAFVFSSQTETQGLVIGEAMLAEIPVVALDSPIQEEIYPEDVAIVVYNQKDFSKKLIEIMEDDKKRKSLVKKAKKFVSDNFSKKKMIDRQLDVFNGVI